VTSHTRSTRIALLAGHRALLAQRVELVDAGASQAPESTCPAATDREVDSSDLRTPSRSTSLSGGNGRCGSTIVP
jgi:hypothetical protein